MRNLLAIVVLLVGGCASVPKASLQADSEGRRFQAPPGRGALYIYRNSILGSAFPISILIDGIPIGELAKDTWLRVDTDANTYLISCTMKGNKEIAYVRVPADALRFVRVGVRIGPRCTLTDASNEDGREAVLAGVRVAGHEAVIRSQSTPNRAVVVYRDAETNVVRLQVIIRYGGPLGLAAVVPFTLVNRADQKVCDGEFIRESGAEGRFSLVCFGGGFSAYGAYSRQLGDAADDMMARGKTPKGQPVLLVVGNPADADLRL